MPTFTLPNGLTVHARNEMDVTSLYQEIFVLNSYLKHGIAVLDSDCVFDIGANIGLFSIHLSRTHKGLRTFAFEPIAETFSYLERNTGLHVPGSKTTLLNIALSDRRGTARFAYDPNFSPTASMYSDEVNACIREGTGMREWARAGALDLPRVSSLPQKQADRLLKLLDTPVVGTLIAAGMYAALLASVLRKRIFTKYAECELSTVSDVIRDHQVEAIGLMKIDVEGSEMDVIRGIAPEDWPRIRQFVVEVHDVDGRVQKIRDILEARGYATVVEQLDFETLKILKNFTIYAVKRP
jgi:FkbM family methyltransferase